MKFSFSQLLGYVLLIVSLIGSCSIIFSLFCNHFSSYPFLAWFRCGSYLFWVYFSHGAISAGPKLCLCHSARHMHVCMPGFNLWSCDIIDHKDTCSLHHCQCTFRPSSLPVPVIVMEFHAERIHSADPHQLCACEMTDCISLPPLHSTVLVLWPTLVSECYCQEFPWELVLAVWIWSLPLIKPKSNSF